MKSTTSYFLLGSLSVVLYSVALISSSLIFGIYAYFLATLGAHGLPISSSIRATFGISGFSMLYITIGILFVYFLMSFALFSYVAAVLDTAFVGAFAYVAWQNRDGVNQCDGTLIYGSNTGQVNGGLDKGSTCKLVSTCFVSAIVSSIIFILRIPITYNLLKHQRRERSLGPSPHNGYTSHMKLWQIRPWRVGKSHTNEPNPDALPAHPQPSDLLSQFAATEIAEPRLGYSVGVGAGTDRLRLSSPHPIQADPGRSYRN